MPRAPSRCSDLRLILRTGRQGVLAGSRLLSLSLAFQDSVKKSILRAFLVDVGGKPSDSVKASVEHSKETFLVP